ncbi:MAG: asparagine synthase (glutamine-hydrolyzing), partial [Nanoarchaeota archaeon]|nr:asparagine synthase (glutamine-hydrolyzing) [Nanoarchaeota archaeon]
KIKNMLFISRDRLGIKPLYYYYDGEKIVFASEIKAILEDKTIPRIPNDEIVYGYLLYNLHDHSEKTFFKGIKSLPPGHSMVVRKNSMKIMKYWGIEIKSIKDSDEKYAINTRELLEDSIKLRLISEVPIGSCLSGGIDSTSIVSLINNVIKSGGNYDNTIGERQKTFSAVYKNNKIDESKHIENVISYTGAEKNFTYPTAKGLWKDIRKIVYHQDEPFIGPSIYAQWEVMKLASKKVKVVLDGQGSDEIFAGYMPYHIIHIMNLVKHGRILRAGQEFIKSADFIVPFIFNKSVFKKRDKTIKSMLNNIFVDKYNNIIQSKWKVKNLNDLLYLEVTKQSIPKLLRYEDRNSMAFSVEARVPFLDYRLVEYAFSMPEKQKIRKGWTKYVLRNAMKGIIPESVRKRRDKIGFDVPEKIWLLELKKPVKQLFASKSFSEIKYFDQIEVLKMFDKFCKGKLDDNYARVFWRIIILAIWHDTFIRKLT